MILNNPGGRKLLVDEKGLNKGVKVGECTIRELATCILGHPMSSLQTIDESGFACVPIMVKCILKNFISFTISC